MSRRILLIDDDRLQHRLLQAHFQTFKTGLYTLDGAATYEDGLAKLRSGAYAACLLDYQLGERDGLQLIRDAVAAGCRTPIIFLTAETADDIDLAAMNAGALDYLVKGEITPRMVERSLRYALKLADTLEALRRLATHDELTGLLNRRELDRVLAEECERDLRFGHEFALIMLDVDHFKAVNDRHGHPAGDAVLREVARRIGAQVRTVDRVARFGGEEFAIVVTESNAATALEIATRICAMVAREPVVLPSGEKLPVTISAGVAALPRDSRTDGALIAAADKALYAAKQRGRNRAVDFTAL
ncbi:MAG: GGDEF domain-containing response regulator [Opitutaceae bacterium]|nr:GGDEF domain-containing response regulator [Opitutaceae bacterium]